MWRKQFVHNISQRFACAQWDRDSYSQSNSESHAGNWSFTYTNAKPYSDPDARQLHGAQSG